MKKLFAFAIALMTAVALNATDYFFAGTANGWSNNNDLWKFVEVNGVLTLEVADLYGDFKVCEDGQWHPQHGAAAEGEGVALNGTYNLVKCDDSEDEKDAPANCTILIPEEGDFRYKNAKLTLDASDPDHLVIALVAGTLYDHSLSPKTYQIVGAFNGWDAAGAPSFESIDGVLTVSVESLSGTFKIIEDHAWDNQWATNWETSAALAFGEPYVLGAKGDNGEPANLALANPFGCYKNAVLTLVFNSDDLILTLEDGDFALVENDWFMPGAWNGWKCDDAAKMEPVEGEENTYELLLAEFGGEFKVVYGPWAVELGAAKGSNEQWEINTLQELSYPCDNMKPEDRNAIYEDVTITLVVDYENVTATILINASDDSEVQDDPVPVTCAEAVAAMPANNIGVTVETYIVTGYVTNTNGTISREQQTFWMDDEPGTKKTLQGYWCNLPEGEKDIPLKVGDKITLTGNIMNYNGTAEIKNGDVAIIERAPEVELDTISVSQALARFTAGETGACFIKGKVLKILSTGDAVAQYGNINYWLGDLENENDSIHGFKMYGANNKKYESAADVEFVEGDEILVYAGELKMYNTTPEINGGYFFRMLKSDADISRLDWALGTAYLSEGEWTIEIAKDNNDTKNVLEVVFESSISNGIKGAHNIKQGAITINGDKTDLEEGTISIDFKEVSADGYNIYNVQASLQAGSKIYRLNSLVEFFAMDAEGEEIVLNADRPFVPTEEGQEITCTQAQEYTLNLPAGTDSELSVVVVGYVTDIFADGQTFWMADTKGGGNVIQAYKFRSLSPAGVTLIVDAKVKVAGKLTHYVSSRGASTAEVKNGSVEIIEGGEAIQADEEVNVAEAIEIAQALENNATSEKVYSITGFVASIISPYNETMSTLSFWMSDAAEDRESQEFQAYRVQCSPEIGAKIVEGSKVRVLSKIMHFYQAATSGDNPKSERHVYETVKGGIVELISGPVDEYELVTEEGEYFVNYFDNSGNKLHNETITLNVPVAPVIEGFAFIGWQASGLLDEGIELQAVYEADDLTSAPTEYINPANKAQKLIRQGNVYILSEGKTYSVQGQKVK